jgi:D-alanine transaminase
MKRIGYFNGEIGALEELKIPLCDRSVFYGDAVYDAVLYLNNCPFSLELHLDRLYKSCELMTIDFRMTREQLKQEIHRLVSLWDGSPAMLYLQVTRGAAPRKHEFP